MTGGCFFVFYFKTFTLLETFQKCQCSKLHYFWRAANHKGKLCQTKHTCYVPSCKPAAWTIRRLKYSLEWNAASLADTAILSVFRVWGIQSFFGNQNKQTTFPFFSPPLSAWENLCVKRIAVKVGNLSVSRGTVVSECSIEVSERAASKWHWTWPQDNYILDLFFEIWIWISEYGLSVLKK